MSDTWKEINSTITGSIATQRVFFQFLVDKKLYKSRINTLDFLVQKKSILKYGIIYKKCFRGIILIQKALVSPKVFISYSWTNSDHEEWVVELATRLMHDGIEVILDKWNLKEGNDTFAFMEGMVKSADSIDKVLIICDKGYQNKADNRVGGVGVESQIITPQIYSDVQQEKFIPIVSERDEQGNHFIPTYIASRLYIDLSSSEFFEANYEKLIRNIYKVPLYKKPSIGKPPEYLFHDETPHYETTLVLRQMKSALDKYPNRLTSLWERFTEAFIGSLIKLKIEVVKDGKFIDEQIVERIEESIPLRNDFINAVELICLADRFEAEQMIEFFEVIYSFSEMQEDGQFIETQFDHFKFLITELFLYTITILLKERRYSQVGQLLSADYYVNSRYKNGRPIRFSDFRFHLRSLENRKIRLKVNRISIHADMIKEKVYGRYEKELIATDLILYYASKFGKTVEDRRLRVWFPITYIYFNERETIKLISRLNSKSHFEKVKTIFGVEDENLFRQMLDEFEFDRGYHDSWDGIPGIQKFISPEVLCTLP